MPKPIESASRITRQRSLLRLLMALSVFIPMTGLNAAVAPHSATVTTKTLPPAPAFEETVYFITAAGPRRVLGRSNSDGSCKAYLGPAGRGWLPYPDPSVPGDDLVGIPGPNGMLALLSKRSGAVNLYLVSEDGHNVTPVTEDQGGIVNATLAGPNCATFSPDGKKIAFVARGSAWMADVTTLEMRTLGRVHGVRAVAWSPDGQWLGVISADSIHKLGMEGVPDVLLVASGCEVDQLAWAGDQIYYYGHGLRRVTAQRRTDLLIPDPIEFNNVSLSQGSKTAVLLAPAGASRPEVFMTSLGAIGKATLLQVTQGGAEAAWASLVGKQIYFLRHGRLWRCEQDGGKAKLLGADDVDHVTIGLASPLKGVCP